MADQYAANILKPSGNVTFKAFIERWRFLAIVSVVQALAHVIFTAKYFYRYLTVWAIISNSITFYLLYIAHLVNGDFKQKYYTAPIPNTPENQSKYNVMNRDSLPFKLWPAIHVFYEWTLVVNSVVTCAFWLMEGPFLIYYFRWSSGMSISN